MSEILNREQLRDSQPPMEEDVALADHELDSVEAVARFHSDHADQATRPQRLIDALTAALAQPTAVFATTIAVVMVAGFAAYWTKGGIHGPMFVWLEFAATVSALLIAMVILVTQTRADALAERRARLTLELALLADKRGAKLVSLLEEMRRDDPNLRNRADPVSEAMSTPTDAHAVSRAIEQKDA